MVENKDINKYFSFKVIKKNEAFDVHKNIILLTFDDNYVSQTINLIMSISKFHKEEISYICLCPCLSQENIEVLLDLTEGIKLYCVEFQGEVATGKWPQCAMFRLFAPWLLEDNIHKVLYLDSDILCTGNIDRLLNMETNYIAMCAELAGNIQPHQQNKIQKFMPTQLYCNSGVCLLNLNALRRDFSPNVIYNAFREMRLDLCFPDQDFLNFYFKEKIQIMNSFLYNFQPYEIKNAVFYKRALHNCRLIHFSAHKPWSHHCSLYLSALYLKYTEYSPMRAIVKRARFKSYFHAIVRLNRPVRRWYEDTYLYWKKHRKRK